MAESRTWTILTALAAQLATITTANGYLTDAGNNVWTTDHQRTAALGLMVYSESIVGTPGSVPGKDVRDFGILIEAEIDTALDDAQQQIHALIEDVDACLDAYARKLAAKPGSLGVGMFISDIAILDRPEGASIIAMQARVAVRYVR